MNEVKVTLSEKERKTYDTMKADLVVSLGDEQIDAGNAAALANKLSQMANGAVYGAEAARMSSRVISYSAAAAVKYASIPAVNSAFTAS